MERIDRMLPDLYKAAVKGKPDDYYEVLRRMESYKTSGEGYESDDYYEVLRQMEEVGVGRQVTPKGNTVLHVAALHGQKHFVERLLLDREDTYPMLLAKNHKNRTVLHCAAEKGHAEIVSVIINNVTKKAVESGVGVREMIQMTDIVGDTALHKAVRMGHVEVVKLLIQEDCEFEYPPNDAGETPIYIAAESNREDPLLEKYGECLVEMVQRFEKPSYGGPLGRNALHAAVLSGGMSGLAFLNTDTECMSLLLEKEICLCEMKDDFGWTPLHYAARINNREGIDTILKAKSSAAYIRAGREDDWTTVFHIAAREGHDRIMEHISNRCPDCWEMVNSKGQNVLHEAIQSGEMDVFKYIERCNQLDSLASEGDEDGNTPIHLLPIYEDYWSEEFVQNLLRKDNKKQLVFNKQHQNPTDRYMEHVGNLFNFNDTTDEHYFELYGRYGQRADLTKNSRKKISSTKKGFDINEMVDFGVRKSETNIIVATLIATITFAAGFTVPGGYNSNVDSEEAGKAILIRNAAFKAFVVTDVVAFICSMLAVYIFGSVVEYAATPYIERYRIVIKLSILGTNAMGLAYLGVGIAFLCGMYAALEPSLPLAIAVLALGAAIPLLACCRYKKIYLPQAAIMKMFNI
ncbi:ankyrin repeat-containing protein At5g02620-like [Ipomoea triloba]|uniref:ankyrin repeat-containing protein At5g02620-like n=1 Tax=Ipomoea triloba TaxID=35885 RepID=UPI00125E7DFA|nr:ankyrin repeat-containing protein At5g02620-like [Ipomoea triloba]